MGDTNFVKNEISINGKIYFDPRNWFRKRYNKDTVKVLFVDDNDMPIAENLKKSGWNVKKIRDVTDERCDDVVSRQIIFVDYDGVGRRISSQHQGAGLVKKLKEVYGSSKYVVLYTSQKALPTDTILKSYFEYADDKIPKDADETDFLGVINRAFEKIR